MITSEKIQNLSADDFYVLYSRAKINSEVETVMSLIYIEQHTNGNKIMAHDVNHLSDLYQKMLLEELGKRLSVSSMYVQSNKLFVDWSLPKGKA